MSTLEYLTEHRMPVYAGIFAIMLASVIAFVLLHSSAPQQPPPPPPVTMVVIQPPKPPPPPPPLPQPKTIQPPKMTTPVAKPIVQSPPKMSPPKVASAPALGTSLKGNGSSNAFDLSGNDSGDGILGGYGNGNCNSDCGSYEDAVSSQIRDALQQNPITRKASAGLVVSVWTDASGRITRVSIDKSSGNPTVDDAVEHHVLAGLQLSPPPPNTPMPIIMSLTGEQALQ